MVSIFALLGLAASATAATIRIDAGQNGLTFTPDTVTAAVGDILEFHFHPLLHSVVMGDFSNPCQPASSGGFFSGFISVSSGEGANVFQVEVNSTDPLFFYCSQNTGSHCVNGMSGVVNANSSQSLATYKNNAKSVASAASPPSPFGGVLVPNHAASASASASGSATSAPAASATSACPATTTTKASGGSGGYKRQAADPCTTTAAGATTTPTTTPNAAASSAASFFAVFGLAGLISMLII